jgi:hypothetical protein
LLPAKGSASALPFVRVWRESRRLATGAAGRPKGSTKYTVDEAVSAGAHALGGLSIAELLRRSLTWDRVQAAAAELYEEHAKSKRSVRTTIEREFADSAEPHAQLIGKIAARIRVDGFLQRVDGPTTDILRDLLADARSGAAIFPESVWKAARTAFATTRQLPIGSESELHVVHTRLLAWGQAPLSTGEAKEVATRSGAYRRLWRDLIRAFDREIRPSSSITRLVQAIGALEDGLLLQALSASPRKAAAIDRLFADGVVHLVEGNTYLKRSP